MRGSPHTAAVRGRHGATSEKAFCRSTSSGVKRNYLMATSIVFTSAPRVENQAKFSCTRSS